MECSPPPMMEVIVDGKSEWRQYHLARDERSGSWLPTPDLQEDESFQRTVDGKVLVYRR
jgi:hypothetical protein